MRRIGMIGNGRIAGPVVQYIEASPDWSLAAVLVRNRTNSPSSGCEVEAEGFFSRPYDLIIEAAGPSALRDHGERALGLADTWTVSGGAVVDDALRARLEAAGRKSGHRLRLVSGSIAGLDGVASIFTDQNATLRVLAERPGLTGTAGPVFEGSLRDAVSRFPHEVNVAAAAAVAGAGMEATRVGLHDTGPNGVHRLSLVAEADFARLTAELVLRPLQSSSMHPVAASLIAALKSEARVIWAG